MKIDGSAFGQRIASPAAGGTAARAANPYDAEIRRLQKQRQEYIEKLQKIREETSDPEQAERLAKTYQMAISGIDSRIAQLQKAKTDEAQRKAEERQEKVEPSRESRESEKAGEAGETSKTKGAEKPESAQKAETRRTDDDPFALQEGEELFWIEAGDRFWPGKKREPKYPSVAIDISI